MKKIINGILLFFIFSLSFGISLLGVELFSTISQTFFSEKTKASVYDIVQATMTPEPVTDAPPLPSVTGENQALPINAGSFIAVRFDHGQKHILLGGNEKQKLPVASLTKLMTALVVLEHYDLSQKVTIDQLAMAQEGEQGNLKEGESLSVKDLLYLTLIESSNRAAFALSEGVGVGRFVALMNEDAQKLGLINTHFTDSTGLDAGSYSSAEDIEKLSEYLFENYPLLRQIIGLKEFDLYLDNGSFHHKLINTNALLGQDNVIGGKTGFTDEAQGCFMVLQKDPANDGYFIYVILGAKDKFSQMQKLINWVNINNK